MKRVIIPFFFCCLISFALSVSAGAVVPMTNYCAIPPYVSQNVPPNIMLLVDNSGSMYNLAFACPMGRITTAGTNISTASFTVDNGTGFKPNQRLALNHTDAGVTSTQVVWLSSIAVDNTNPLNPIYTLTLTVPATISTNDTIQDYGCSGTLFYETAPSTTTCPTAAMTCNSVSGGDTTVYTGYTNNSSTTIYVNSNSNFVCGEDIIVYHGGTAYKRTLASSGCTGTTSGTPWVKVTSSVTYSSGDQVVDFCKYSSNASNGIISVDDDTGFSVGQRVVLYHNSAPVALTITSIDTSANTFTVTPVASVSGAVSKGDTLYDYNCFYSHNPYPEESFEDTKEYYGYFDTAAWYTYNTTSTKFVKSRQKSAGAKLATEWDGNFLNWLTMRRTDIVRKVFTGGRTAGGEAAGLDKLYGVQPDSTGRGVYKAVNQAENYTGLSLTGTGNTMNFTFPTGSATWNTTTPGSFSAESGNAGAGYTARGSFKVSVVVPAPVEGVLQDLVGTRARLGLTMYNGDNGGKVLVNVGDASLANVIKGINGVAITNAEGGTNYTAPVTNTPLGEALWTVVGYFAQSSTLEGGDTTVGPMYNNSGTSASYKINATADPLNYGTASVPKYLSCATNYVLAVTDGEPCADGSLPANIKSYTGTAGNTSQFVCTSGSPHCNAEAPFPQADIPSCNAGNNWTGVERVALYGHQQNLRTALGGFQNLNMYFVFAFGQGSTILNYSAINGGYDIAGAPSAQGNWDNNDDNVPDNYYEANDPNTLELAIRNTLSTVLKRVSSGTSASVLASGEGSGANLIQAVFYPRRRVGNDIIGWAGSLQNLWYYVDPFFKNSQIREDTDHNAVLGLTSDYISQLYFDTATQTTRANLFTDTNGDGAADPSTPVASKTFEQLNYLWEAGTLLWGRNETSDPRKTYTSIGSGLTDFSVANEGTLQPYLNLTDRNGDANLAAEGQYLIRFIRGDELTSIIDSEGNITTIGVDQDGDGVDDFRNRTVTIGSGSGVWKLGDIIESTPRISSWLPLNTYHKTYSDTTYGAADDPRLGDAADSSHFVTTEQYKDRGMVFAGANDGMLHAFKLGQLQLEWSGQTKYQKARLWNREAGTLCQATSDGSDPSKNACGREIWSFIPKNVLPYLNYIADPDYCHIYSVNLTPFVFDASTVKYTGCTTNYWDCPRTVSSWKTILIGGMRTGGACRQTTSAYDATKACKGNCSVTTGTSCTTNANCPGGETCQSIHCCNTGNCSITTATSCTTDANCPVGPPAETCVPNCVNTPVNVSGADVGYSSYFALDITDQNNPTLMWEFSDPRLGFATTGPAIVRINAFNGSGGSAAPDNTKNGKWFVIFGSGPTGPIDKGSQQFLGRSDQEMKFLVFDLQNGPSSGVTQISTGIQNAFAGNMLNSAVDNDLDYQDDAIYVGYTSKSGATWTNGGVGRLRTDTGVNKDDAQDPGTWSWSKVIENIGPVTTAVARLQNTRTNTLWLFFGTGRYFYDIITTPDDSDSNRQIFGIKEPCFITDSVTNKGKYAASCPAALSGVGSPLTNVTNVANVTSTPDDPAFKGWYINLDPTDTANGYSAERVKSDPLALSSGLVLFTTLKPYNSTCKIGGKSYVWAAKYNTGGEGGALLKGKAIIQVSTGAIEQVDMATAFTDPGTGNRRTSASMEGVAPGGPPAFISSPPAVKKVVHIRER